MTAHIEGERSRRSNGGSGTPSATPQLLDPTSSGYELNAR
jgi:hypothetical protein